MTSLWLRVCVDCPSCPDHLRGPGIRWNHCPSVSNGKSQGAGGCRAFWREVVAGAAVWLQSILHGRLPFCRTLTPWFGERKSRWGRGGMEVQPPSGLPLTAQPACFWARNELRISRWLCVCLWMWQGMGTLCLWVAQRPQQVPRPGSGSLGHPAQAPRSVFCLLRPGTPDGRCPGWWENTCVSVLVCGMALAIFLSLSRKVRCYQTDVPSGGGRPPLGLCCPA